MNYIFTISNKIFSNAFDIKKLFNWFLSAQMLSILQKQGKRRYVSIIHLSMYILSVDVSKYKFDVKYGTLISFVAIFKKKFMATTEMDWCEKVVYWKMMCFDHSFHLSLLNDHVIFWLDGKRWAEKPHHSRPALNRYAWHVKMLVSEMICRCWLLFHHL